MKITKGSIVAFILIILLSIYLLGPKLPSLELKSELPEINLSPGQLENEIASREAAEPLLKPDNNARIIWFDSSKKEKTPYCILYLHGFSASWKEADPIHIRLAKKFGCNLYLPRLFAHGMQNQEPLLEMNAEKYVESARNALAEAMVLGQKVIIMSTSTGGTLSLYLASEIPEIAGLILYSPNIALFDKKAFVLSQPWGLQLARRVVKSNYYTFEGDSEVQKYWNTTYRIEALITLKNLMDKTMTKETFQKIKQPVFLGYYYKNNEEQDKIVSVHAMLKMYGQLGTPDDLKQRKAFENVNAHALASGINSKDLNSVESATSDFMRTVLRLPELK